MDGVDSVEMRALKSRTSRRSDGLSFHLNETPIPTCVNALILQYVNHRLDAIDTGCGICGRNHPSVRFRRMEACVQCRSELISNPLVEHLIPPVVSIILDYMDGIRTFC